MTSLAHTEPRLAQRMDLMQPSAVREILKVAGRPEVLSFAGGLPAPELFPIEAIAAAHARVLARDGAAALQYSTTEGYGPLREWIAARLAAGGMRVRPDGVLVTSGSQQGIDLAARVLIDPGDVILVENPTYLAAVQAFAAYQAKLVPVPSDDDGMQVDGLEELILRHRPKLLYVVPNFQNPKGTTMALDRRRRLAALADQHGVVVLEDDPYGELIFRGERVPAIASLGAANTLHVSTFSKTLAPGLRIAWMSGNERLVRKATILKQAADLHTATLAQRAASALLESFDLDAHLRKLRAVYGERCAAMTTALREVMPAGTTWIDPRGGMFVWVRLPNGLDAEALFPLALERQVAFVPGSAFFVDDVPRDFLRLNFSNRPADLIREGMRRLGEVVHAAVASPPPPVARRSETVPPLGRA
ncbi:MAG: PLP-dependent aminotransferase family protein [Kofleriaceae bacterium]